MNKQINETKERPILFSGPMVRAILDGRKTQTRRVVKPSQRYPIDFVGAGGRDGPDWDNPNCWGFESSDAEWWMLRADDANEHQIPCPYGAPGDRLYVRESWCTPIDTAPEVALYRADYPKCVPSGYENIPPADEIKWKPSIHMPRWASRITLEVKRRWVERVREISWLDAIAEGIKDPRKAALRTCPERGPVADFRTLWDSINAANGYGWDANPWVWCVEYECVEGER